MSIKKMLIIAATAALTALSAPALAANPFMDVPMNSWAYDAVDQLYARGVISGYPDGTFKGNQPITRYEMASMVARAMAYMEDHDLADQDLEVLKRLMVEFKDELDALGVRVDDLDGRLAGLEENLGGWKFWGELQFDANWRDDSSDSNFSARRVRLWISKNVNENLSFTTRIRNNANEPTGQDMEFNLFFMDAKNLFGGWDLRVGRWIMDWEGEDDLYISWDGFMSSTVQSGIMVTRNFDRGFFKAFMTDGAVTSSEYSGNYGTTGNYKTQATQFGGRLRLDFNEKFWLSLNGLWKDFSDTSSSYGNGLYSNNTYWAALGFKFTPFAEIKGAYFIQDNDWAAGVVSDDSPDTWKVILDLDQEALKFTSLWVEYGQYGEGSVSGVGGDMYDDYYDGNSSDYVTIPTYRQGRFQSDVDVLYAVAEQRWTPKWATYERFLYAKDGAPVNGGGFDDVVNWSFGVKWFYHPSLTFDLSYDDIDYGDGNYNGRDSDHVIRLRTHLRF